MVALCVTMVTLADNENAQHIAEVVREGVSSVTQQGMQKLQGQNVPQQRSANAFSDNKLRASQEEAHGALDTWDEESLLASLQEQESSLRDLIRRKTHEVNQASSQAPKEELQAAWDNEAHPSNIVLEESHRLRASSQARASLDRRHRAQVDFDEEELEFEEADQLRKKLHQKKDAVALARETQRYHKHVMAQNGAQVAAPVVAVVPATEAVPAKNVAVASAHSPSLETTSEHMELPNESQDLLSTSSDVSEGKGSDSAVTMAVQKDPDVRKMKAEVAALKQTLTKAKAKAKLAREHPKQALHQLAREHPKQALKIMQKVDPLSEIEVSGMGTKGPHGMMPPPVSKDKTVPKAAKIAPPNPSVESSPAEDIVDVARASPKHVVMEPVEEPEVEGGEAETESDAEVSLLQYALWISLGALVVGCFGTVLYFACQQPRDRPHGMPRKRNYG